MNYLLFSASFSFTRLALSILFVSLALLVLVIAYRKLLAYLGKGNPVKEDYCVLYSLEEPISRGEVQIYFTCEKEKEVAVHLYNEQMEQLMVIKEDHFGAGGHIVTFDTSKVANGNYFYGLKTENQKTMKKMLIRND
jgi:hypothetical protein